MQAIHMSTIEKIMHIIWTNIDALDEMFSSFMLQPSLPYLLLLLRAPFIKVNTKNPPLHKCDEDT